MELVVFLFTIIDKNNRKKNSNSPKMRAWCKKETRAKISTAQLCPTLETPWTAACQAPLSMAFSRQEYWSGLPFPSPGDLPDPWMKPRSPVLYVDCLPIGPPGKPIKVTGKSTQIHPKWGPDVRKRQGPKFQILPFLLSDSTWPMFLRNYSISFKSHLTNQKKVLLTSIHVLVQREMRRDMTPWQDVE